MKVEFDVGENVRELFIALPILTARGVIADEDDGDEDDDDKDDDDDDDGDDDDDDDGGGDDLHSLQIITKLSGNYPNFVPRSDGPSAFDHTHG